MEDAASVGYGCVLRGDLAPIRLGAQSSLGDRVVVGTARRADAAPRPRPAGLPGLRPRPRPPPRVLPPPPPRSSVPTGLSPAASIGRNVTVGPGSLLRSATVEDEVVVGARCTLLEGSVVETGAVLEPGTLLPPGRRVPARQVWGGAPAHFVRDTGYDEAAAVVRLSEDLAVLGAQHKEARLPLADEALYEEAAAVRAGLAAAAAARAGAGAGAIAAGGASEAGRVAA